MKRQREMGAIQTPLRMPLFQTAKTFFSERCLAGNSGGRLNPLNNPCALNKYFFPLAVLAIMLTLNSCEKKPAPSSVAEKKSSMNVKETRLALIPEGYEIGGIVFSPDGHRSAFKVVREGKWFVFSGEIKDGPYDLVQEIVFSSDSSSVAYVAKRDKKKFIVVNGREGMAYDDVGEPVFSPDGTLVAYEVEKEKRWYIALDGSESDGCDLFYGPPIFSPDGSLITYVEQHFDRKKVFRVVSDIGMKNPKKGNEYESLTSFVISPDKSRVAYGVGRDGKQFIVISDFEGVGAGEKEGPAYDSVSNPVFSPDGRKVAYLAEKKGRRFLVIDNKEQYFPVDNLISPPFFSPDGSRIALVAARNKSLFIMIDGKEGKPYEDIGPPVFSADSSEIAYPAQKNGKWLVVVNGKEGNMVYDMVVSPLFSPHGSRLAFRARKDGKRFIVLADSGGNVLKQYPAYEAVWQQAFSHDGSSITYGVLGNREIWWKVESLE